MDLTQLETFFLWMTLINFGLMVLSAIMCVACRGVIHQLHGKMFDLTNEQLNVLLYGYLGIYKICIIVFNLVPYIALQFVE